MSSRKRPISDTGSESVARAVSAAAAGVLSAVPMAFVMWGLEQFLSKREQYATLPEEITTVLAARAGVVEKVHSRQDRRAATWLMHLGYAGATASFYPFVTHFLPLPGILRGMVFAFGVYSLSYMGWLPAMNILPPATQMPPRRNLVMIASHLVWGGLIGWIMKKKENQYT